MFTKGPREEIRNIAREEIMRYAIKKNKPPTTRHGEEWTQQEENHLIGELKASIFLTARFHRRSPVAIAFKLFKLWREGKFDDLRYHRTWKGDE